MFLLLHNLTERGHCWCGNCYQILGHHMRTFHQSSKYLNHGILQIPQSRNPSVRAGGTIWDTQVHLLSDINFPCISTTVKSPPSTAGRCELWRLPPALLPLRREENRLVKGYQQVDRWKGGAPWGRLILAQYFFHLLVPLTNEYVALVNKLTGVCYIITWLFGLFDQGFAWAEGYMYQNLRWQSKVLDRESSLSPRISLGESENKGLLNTNIARSTTDPGYIVCLWLWYPQWFCVPKAQRTNSRKLEGSPSRNWGWKGPLDFWYSNNTATSCCIHLLPPVHQWEYGLLWRRIEDWGWGVDCYWEGCYQQCQPLISWCQILLRTYSSSHIVHENRINIQQCQPLMYISHWYIS